jgi:hypothetical protein
MLARRLLLLAAVLMLLTALAAGLAPQQDDATTPSAPRPGPTPTTVPGAMSAEATDQTLEARVGDLIQLEVDGDVLDEVHIERLDRYDPIEPTTPARFEVIPETAGVYPIRLVEADRRIGRLEITP